MARARKFPIRKRVYPSGAVRWRVDLGIVAGKRTFVLKETKREAEDWLEEHEEERERHGELGRHLSTAELVEFRSLSQRCAQLGGTLAQAVEFWARHGQTLKAQLKIAVVYARFLDAKDDRSPRYRRQLGVSLGPFIAGLGDKPACEVAREDVLAWLRGNGWAPKTQNNYLGDVRALFGWAKREGYVTMDPCQGIDKMRAAEVEIQTFSVAQCQALLTAAREHPAVMPYLVIALFGGVRPEELQRITWAEVNLIERTVIVLGAKAKTRQRRVVDLTPNAVAWIKTMPQVPTSGPVCPPGWRMLWQGFRKACGYQVPRHMTAERMPWPHDVLRHTYASMHYAQHQEEAKLQVQMGHTSATVLHRHYRALTTRAEAAKFWALKPDWKIV